MKLLTTFLFAFFLSTTSMTASENDEKAFELPRSKTIVLQDSETKRFYDIHIQLPKRYSPDQKYPVVYMTDSPYTFPITVGAARYPINFKKMENVMFVGISWEKDYRPGLSRQRDYTPTDSSPGFKDPSGQADKHLAFIRNDVIEYVEKNYSTETNRRTYIGNSFGGLLGAYFLLTAPDTFHNYILGSPSLWWDNKYILKLEAKANKLSANTNANVFISVGENENPSYGNNKHDMVGDAKTFYERLQARNIKNLSLKLLIIDSANHETAYPTTAIQGLWWLFKTENKSN